MAPERCSLSQRFVLFGGGGGGGQTDLTATSCHCSSKVWAPPWILGRPSLRLCSHSKEALGQEAGRQGYSLENGRTLGALAGAPEAAAAAAVVRCTTHWAGSPSGGRLRGLLGAWAQAQADRQDVGCRSTRPPRGALLASSTLRLQQGRALGEGKCVGQTG